jgi:hypothetical protein
MAFLGGTGVTFASWLGIPIGKNPPIPNPVPTPFSEALTGFFPMAAIVFAFVILWPFSGRN